MSRAEAWAREAQAAETLLTQRPRWRETHGALGVWVTLDSGGGVRVTVGPTGPSGMPKHEVTLRADAARELAAFLAHWCLEDPEPTVVYHCGVRQEATP